MYTTGDLVKHFGVSRQTISVWCKEFAHYLSPTANPPRGAQRRFTESDMAVLTLVHGDKRRGLKVEEIHAALSAGQRGEVPQETAVLTSTHQQAALTALQNRIRELENELAMLRQERDQSAGRADLAEALLREAQAEVARLNREVGRLGG